MSVKARCRIGDTHRFLEFESRRNEYIALKRAIRRSKAGDLIVSGMLLSRAEAGFCGLRFRKRSRFGIFHIVS
jgi:hypothetical protein